MVWLILYVNLIYLMVYLYTQHVSFAITVLQYSVSDRSSVRECDVSDQQGETCLLWHSVGISDSKSSGLCCTQSFLTLAGRCMWMRCYTYRCATCKSACSTFPCYVNVSQKRAANDAMKQKERTKYIFFCSIKQLNLEDLESWFRILFLLYIYVGIHVDMQWCIKHLENCDFSVEVQTWEQYECFSQRAIK